MYGKTWWVALTLAALVGCGAPAPTSAPEEASPTSVAAAPGEASPTIEATASNAMSPSSAIPGDDDPDDPAKPLTEKNLEQIRKLDPADQEIAIAQKNCPISGQHLGSMGKPVKKVVDGRTAFLCCAGCEEDFDKDPQAAIAKIDKN